MYWLKRHMWKAGIAIAGILLLLVLMVWVPMSAVDAHEIARGLATPIMVTVQSTPTEDATVTALNKGKLEHENNWFWTNGATLFSTFAIVLAGIFGFVRYLTDRRIERAKQREDHQVEQEKRNEEQKRWLDDRQAEREKRAEERFQSVVEGLGSTSLVTQVGAAIMLRTFLRPDYKQFYSQVFDLAVAYLRLRNIKSEPERPDSFEQALIFVFKESFPLARDLPKQDAQQLDAMQIHLDYAYLARSDLSHSRMPEAYLREANLFEVNLKAANLRDSILIGAHLANADLSEANLSRADLSGVHLERAASLKGTRIQGVKGLTKEQLDACLAKGAIIENVVPG